MVNTDYILPILILVIVAVTLLHRISAYHSFTEGVGDGTKLLLDIYPALLAMMCTIVLLWQSGLMDILCNALAAYITDIPKEIWPMAIFRSIPESASLAVLVDIFQVRGIDLLAGSMVGIIQGSTNTTVYMIAPYFSSVGIRRIKNALATGLLVGVAGISMTILLALHVFA